MKRWLPLLMIFAFPGMVLAAQVAQPTASPVPGTYTSAQSVTLSDTTSGATICYTTDGTTPGTNGSGSCSGASTTTYSSAITVSSTETIKAVGTKNHDTDSTLFSGLYTINIPAASPTQVGAFEVGP